MKFAVIVCSDTRTLAQDTAGIALESLIGDAGWQSVSRTVVADERTAIAHAIEDACDHLCADIVITCGGTGLSPRDVTPEATQDVCERMVPGIAEGMRAYSMKFTDRAMLSRAVCMQRGNALVINFPGSEKAVRENWEAVSGVLEHALKMIAGAGH
jgi:molybdenum cofactor synthesis domain-containing protein